MRWLSILVLGAVLLIASCGDGGGEPETPASPAPEPTATKVPTATPEPVTRQLLFPPFDDCDGMPGICIEANEPIYDGSFVTQLTSDACDHSAVFTKDGQSVLFVQADDCSGGSLGPGTLYRINVDGSGLTSLGLTTVGIEPSPEGTMFAYAQDIPCAPGIEGCGATTDTRINRSRCVVASMAYGATLHEVECARSDVRWFPDSSAVAFRQSTMLTSDTGLPPPSRSAILRLDGSRVFTPAGIVVIGWTEDGQLLMRSETWMEVGNGVSVNCPGAVVLGNDDAEPGSEAPLTADEFPIRGIPSS